MGMTNAWPSMDIRRPAPKRMWYGHAQIDHYLSGTSTAKRKYYINRRKIIRSHRRNAERVGRCHKYKHIHKQMEVPVPPATASLPTR